MQTIVVGIPMPASLKEAIGHLCYGLPDCEWVREEQLFFQLLHYNDADGQTLLDLKEKLELFHFNSFVIPLKAPTFFNSKKNQTQILIEPSNTAILKKLLREWRFLLKDTSCKPLSSPCHILLGKCSQVSSARRLDFLEATFPFGNTSLQVESLALFTLRPTFVQEEAVISLSS